MNARTDWRELLSRPTLSEHTVQDVIRARDDERFDEAAARARC
jgi:hypothetical protein